MKTNQILKLSLFVSLLTTGLASANPSAVGQYGGTAAASDFSTLAAFNSTRQGRIKDIEIVGLQAYCVSTIPGMGDLPAEVRSTNITRRETPQLRLRRNGTFAGSFLLDDPGRVDFHNAEVRITGRLSGRRGVINFEITQNESFIDGSSIACGGSVRIPVRLARRR